MVECSKRLAYQIYLDMTRSYTIGFVCLIRSFMRRHGNNGFTLIELVIILIVLGIIAAVAIPRLADTTSLKASATARKLRSDIAYAQELAMTRNLRTRVYFNGTGTAPAPQGYAVVIDNSASGNCASFAAVTDPAGGGSLGVTLDSGDYAGITAVPSMTCLEYDSLGRPYDCIANLAVCSATAGGMSITFSPSGTVVTVTNQTGKVG